MTDVLFRKIVAEPPEVIEPNTAYLILKGEGEAESFDLLVSSASGDRLVPLDMAAAAGGGAVVDPKIQLMTLDQDLFIPENQVRTVERRESAAIAPFTFTVEAGKKYRIEAEFIVGWGNPGSTHQMHYELWTETDRSMGALPGDYVFTYPEKISSTDVLSRKFLDPASPNFNYAIIDTVMGSVQGKGNDTHRLSAYVTATVDNIVHIQSYTAQFESKTYRAGSWLSVKEVG